MLETGYENAWVTEILIKNVIVNARGNHGKQLTHLFHPLPHLLHSDNYLGSTPPADDDAPTDDASNTTPHVPPAHAPHPNAGSGGNAMYSSPPPPSPHHIP